MSNGEDTLRLVASGGVVVPRQEPSRLVRQPPAPPDLRSGARGPYREGVPATAPTPSTVAQPTPSVEVHVLAADLVGGLAALFEIREPAEAGAFLAVHPRVVPLLLEALPRVAEVFGPAARVALETQVEYSGARTLYAVVLVAGSDEELLERLDRFDRAWWLDHVDPQRGPVCFTVGRP